MHRNDLDEPPVKAKPDIDLEELFEVHPEFQTDSHIYVHCHFKSGLDEVLIRIWMTTFLVDQNSSARSKLVHIENITYAPHWTLVPTNYHYSFLLIFESLPKSCAVFDLIEDIPQPGGFVINDISRNKKDVYHIDLPME